MGINVFILEHELIVEIPSIPLCKMFQSICKQSNKVIPQRAGTFQCLPLLTL